LKKKLRQGQKGWSQVKGKKGGKKTNESVLLSDSDEDDDDDDDLTDTPKHRNRGGTNQFLKYAAGSWHANEVAEGIVYGQD
jgi:hypothetical protein